VTIDDVAAVGLPRHHHFREDHVPQTPTELPGSMRAALLSAAGEIGLIDHPTPRPGPGEVVLRVEAASICGSDLSAFRGNHSRIKAPTILGHELAGTIAEIGAGVTGVSLGDRVVAEPNIACGVCRYCRRGAPNVCVDYVVVGEDLSRPGACADYVKAQAIGLHALPANVSMAEGALVQPLAIAHHAVDRGRVTEGQSVLILGAGPIGLGAMLVARERGARTIVVDVLEDRLELARRLGADVTIDPSEVDLDAAVLGVTSGDGPDVTIEAVGGAQTTTFESACRLTARQGIVVVVGSFKHDSAPLPVVSFKFRELEVIGSQGHPGTFAPVLRLIASGALPAADLISHRLPLERIGDGFAILADRAERVMKIVIEP
jgi:L-iditol 2-dehydrogenase